MTMAFMLRISRSLPLLLHWIEVSDAFDLVDHDIFITRLRTSFGDDGLVLCWWITSYLSDRSQFVCVGGSTSTHTRCNIGVPQGLVLGLLFLTLYISPIILLRSCLIKTIFISNLLMSLFLLPLSYSKHLSV